MSHLRIQRKRTESPRIKLHSEESKPNYPKYSVQRIIHETINKRRFTTHNSPNRSQKSQESFTTIKLDIDEAKKAYKEKNTKKSLLLFKQLSKKYPKSPEIPFYIGSCLLNQRKYESSIHYFKLSLKLDPMYDKNTYLYLAVSEKALRNYRNACQVLNEAIQRFPRFQEAFFYRAKMKMKLGELIEANQDLKKCLIMNSANELAYIFLGDNLRSEHKYKQCIEKYEKAVALQGNYQKMAHLKKIDLLLQQKKYEEIFQEAETMKQKKLQTPLLSFYEGLCYYENKKFSEAVIFLEIALTAHLNQDQFIKVFKALFNIAIEEKDFFEAQHLIQRIKNHQIDELKLSHYFHFIEGVNDVIKRKLAEGLEKLSLAKKKIQKLPKNESEYLMKLFLPYYAYCLFSQNLPEESLEVYGLYLKLEQNSLTEQYNKNVCEGIIFNRDKQFEKACQKFTQASFLVKNKIQPLFFNCINEVQRYKCQQTTKQQTLRYLEELFNFSQAIVPQNSLFLFYQSLVRLYQGRDAVQLINQAIKISDEDISEYHYIKGLCYSLKGEHVKGLQCIDKALELDQNISEFFKQRSKYYYILGRYEDACEELEKIIEDTEDDEVRLLLTFYYYMNDQYKESYRLFKSITDNSGDGKFLQFQEALNFRLGNFDRCGMIGQIIRGIVFKDCELSEQFLQRCKMAIEKRQFHSQFTSYHYNLFLAIYYGYSEKFDEALEHLFGALEQIQYIVDEKEEFTSITENMLNEIKFNIIIVSLLKEEDSSKPETLKYIEVFVAETENQQFLVMMQLLIDILHKDLDIRENCSIYQDQSKISDYFPEIQLKIGRSILRTKLMSIYPQKLKFNIAPEFDDSFLYNFDLEKIQNKLCPPWFKVHNQELLFTDKIRNQSILLSETEKAPTPLLVSSPMPFNLKDKFKLDDVVEKKLQKLMKNK